MEEVKDKNRPFLFSHSAKKAFMEKGVCKKNWGAKWVTREIERDPSSEQMIKGIYFETLALGAHSGGETLPDISFMYDAKGNEKVELKRIHEQVERFKELFNPSHEDFLGFKIDSAQELLQSDDKRLKGFLDFSATDLFDKKVVFDLKFTADVDAKGPFGWGRDTHEIDWSQQILYQYLYEQKYGIKPKMYVLVFDASPRKNIRLFDLNIREDSVREMLWEYEDAWYEVDKYMVEGFPAKPSESNCHECPLECEFRYISPVVEKIKVNL